MRMPSGSASSTGRRDLYATFRDPEEDIQAHERDRSPGHRPEGCSRSSGLIIPSLHQRSCRLKEQGWVIEENGTYWPAVYLDPPIPKKDRAVKVGDAWEYESIQCEALADQNEEEAAVPFKNPFERYLPHGWSQNGRGSCAGHAGAIMMRMQLLRLH